MTNNAEIKSEYSRLRALMLKRIGRALEQKPQSKTLQKEQATIKQHNIRDYFNKLTEKQQKRALEVLQRKTENNKIRVQRKQNPKGKSDLERQVDFYKGKRTTLLKRLKSLKSKPYAIDRYLSNAEKYLIENTPEQYKNLSASERFNKLATIKQMELDPLLTAKGMKVVADQQKRILQKNGYEGGENWKAEWKELQRRKKEQRQSTSDADVDEENIEFWYHSGSPLSNAMMEEHNRRLGYI